MSAVFMNFLTALGLAPLDVISIEDILTPRVVTILVLGFVAIMLAIFAVFFIIRAVIRRYKK